MTPPARLATSLVALAATVLAAATVAGASGTAACGAAADGVYLATDYGVAARIAANERSGSGVALAMRTIESDTVLAQAVAHGDLATIRSELIVLLYNHEHIVRIRVMRGRTVLDDIGGANVLAPVSGTLRVGGREVGTFQFSIQDDLGYQLLALRLVGADTVMRYQGRTVLANVAAGSRPLPAHGTVRIGATTYLVASIVTGRFPTGSLDITLLFPVPVAALAQQTCAQVRADVLGAVAEHVYNEAIAGPGVTVARNAIALASTLAGALELGDDATVRAAAPALLRAAHVSRLQVLSGQRVIADVGTRAPLVAPVPVPVTDAIGRDVGTVLLSIQSVSGLSQLTAYLTQSVVFVRQGSTQLAGPRGPATLPASGPLSYGGAHFNVFSYEATRFPTGTLTVYVLAYS